MNFDPDKLKQLLDIMRASDVDKFTLDGLTVEFGRVSTVPLQETPDSRLDRLKQELKRVNEEQDELEAWST